VFPASGGLPVAKRPPQRLAYRLVELDRWRKHLGIPLELKPAFFPVSTDLASRVIIAADLSHGSDAAVELAGHVMASVWAKHENIADSERLKRLAVACGLDGDAILASADEEAAKSRYADYTREAIERQVFGAPFYIYRGEPFWGQDRLEFLERSVAHG
jgi:2-hydroxychromene-2-carboxylate isomerase